jgi:predicted enzyme related to lactoylglutathione lyase
METAMLEQAKIGAIVFFVADLQRTTLFYRDTLGVPLTAIDGHDGPFATAEALAARGVEIVVPVSECPDGGLSVDFVDPDRNALSIYQPPGAARSR